MNAQIRITYRDKDGNEILNPTDGQLGYSSETGRLYKWSAAAGEWQLVDGDINLGMSTYDLNKQIIAQMGIFEKEDLQKASLELDSYIERFDYNYYMLLCRDINYYTIFYVYKGLVVPDNLSSFSSEVLDCAQDIGAIKSIEPVPGDAYEIWVHPVDGDPVAMYLFPYDAGVIECIR